MGEQRGNGRTERRKKGERASERRIDNGLLDREVGESSGRKQGGEKW